MPLNPYQSEVEKLALSLGLRGSAQNQVYQTPQFMELVNRFFGAIGLPAGVTEDMVTSRTPGMVEFRDPEGYITRLERELSGVSPRLGEVRQTSTNRPAVLPIEKSNPILGQILGLSGTQQQGGGDFFGLPNPANPNQPQGQVPLLQQLTNLFSNPVALSQLDPASMKLLADMKAAEDQALDEQFQRELGTTIAQLVGQGVGSSSIASDTLSRVKQGQGLVRNQAQGQQAQRQLGVQQFLTQGQETRNQSLQQFIVDLLNQSLSRDVTGAQFGIENRRLDVQDKQFVEGLEEQIRQFDEQMREMQRQSLIKNILGGVAGVAGLATGIPFGKIFGGGVPAPPIPTTFPSSSVFDNYPPNPRLSGF